MTVSAKRSDASLACCRVEYDAYRVDLEWAGQQGADTGLLAEARRQHDLRLAEYQRLREKVTVKLSLLDENRVRSRNRVWPLQLQWIL